MKTKASTAIIALSLAIKVALVAAVMGLDRTIDVHMFFIKDETRYLTFSRMLADDLRNGQLLHTFANYYYYTGSYHLGHYYLLAALRLLFGDSYLMLVASKGCLYAFGMYYFCEWIAVDFGRRAAAIAAAALVVYVPLQVLSMSLMRDDVIFAVLAVSVYYARVGAVKRSLLSIGLTALFRINAAISAFLYLIISWANRRGIKLNKVKLKQLAPVLGLAAVGFYYGFRSDFIRPLAVELIGKFSITRVLTDIVRLVLSPLPWSIDRDLPDSLRVWFVLSFFMSMGIAISFVLVLLRKRSRFDFALLTLCASYLLPYILSDTLGFRQIAVLAPFIAFPTMLEMMGFRRWTSPNAGRVRIPLIKSEALTLKSA